MIVTWIILHIFYANIIKTFLRENCLRYFIVIQDTSPLSTRVSLVFDVGKNWAMKYEVLASVGAKERRRLRDAGNRQMLYKFSAEGLNPQHISCLTSLNLTYQPKSTASRLAWSYVFTRLPWLMKYLISPIENTCTLAFLSGFINNFVIASSQECFAWYEHEWVFSVKIMNNWYIAFI